jgi:acyl dehydratase
LKHKPFRYYEDFEPGETIELGSCSVDAEEIIEFASEFDPAPFHLDPQAGRDSMLKGHAASGWHSCAMAMRLLCDGMLLNSSCQGSPGVDEARWLIPVYAGDVLTGRATILSKRQMNSRPDVGLVEFRFDYFTAGTDPALSLRHFVMFAKRPRHHEVDNASGTNGP